MNLGIGVNENHGVITGSRSNILVAGIIPFQSRNPGGNWTAWLPQGEVQRNNNTDTMACVSFSLLNCIETQEYFLTGKQVNYSDRWLAKISGTTPAGNYLQTVADTIRQFGLVKEESWPTPDNYTWDSYYAEPTPLQRKNLLLEGAEWLKSHNLQTEWLTTDLSMILKHLEHCPLQIVIPGHAIENFFTQQEIIDYFDSYSPFEKQTNRSSLSDVFKPVLTLKYMRLVNDNGTYYLVGDKGKIGFTDLGALNNIKAIESVEEQGSTAGIPQVGIFESGMTFHK